MDIKSIDIKTIELERLKYAIQQVVTNECLRDIAEVKIIEDYLMDSIRILICDLVWGEHVTEEHREVEYPADWWQAFKERWFPAWLIERYPVKYHTERIEVRWTYKAYPNFRPPPGPGNNRYRIPYMDDPKYFIPDGDPCRPQS